MPKMMRSKNNWEELCAARTNGFRRSKMAKIKATICSMKCRWTAIVIGRTMARCSNRAAASIFCSTWLLLSCIEARRIAPFMQNTMHYSTCPKYWKMRVGLHRWQHWQVWSPHLHEWNTRAHVIKACYLGILPVVPESEDDLCHDTVRRHCFFFPFCVRHRCAVRALDFIWSTLFA